MSHPFSLFEYHPELKLILCKLHKYAILDLEQHLRDAHEIHGAEKHALVAEWRQYKVLNYNSWVPPSTTVPELTELQEPVRGWRCSAPDCQFLTVDRACLMGHCARSHEVDIKQMSGDAVDLASCSVSEVLLQSVWPFPNRVWFPVSKATNPNGEELFVRRRKAYEIANKID